MLINSQTKIAALLKHHPDALEAIITISKDFSKLRNPILRKLMAGRTSIAMASMIGGCKPEDFFEKLEPLGFKTDTTISIDEEIQVPDKSGLQFLKDIGASEIIDLDVREMLAGGNDPLRLIQQHVKDLQKGQVLKIINTFEPVPLIKLLEKQGFLTYTDPVRKDLIETYFYRTKPAETDPKEAVPEVQNDWNMFLQRYENKLEQVDVRHLEMPGPMMCILEKLETLPSDKALYVHHKRIPVFLLNELKDRNFDYRIKEISETEVFLLIFKA